MIKYSILLVDDDPSILEGLSKNLTGEGYQTTKADSGENAIKLLEEESFDLVITDLIMEETDGFQVLKKAKENNPTAMVIVLTGYNDLKFAIDALRLNAEDYLLKPCKPEEILFRVARCFEKLELSTKVKLYENILPLCCVCKKIMYVPANNTPKTGEWISIENYLGKERDLTVTHTYCPECAQKAINNI